MNEVFLLVVSLISPVIFGVVIWLTRAGMKRAAAALAGGLIAAAINIGWDALAWRMGWWRYVFTNDPVAPLIMYIPVALVFGASFGLVGWRLIRASGWTGSAIFYSAYVGLGVIRDHVIAARGDVFVWGPGGLPHVVDAVGHFTLALSVQLTMRVLCGSTRQDSLRAA